MLNQSPVSSTGSSGKTIKRVTLVPAFTKCCLMARMGQDSVYESTSLWDKKLLYGNTMESSWSHHESLYLSDKNPGIVFTLPPSRYIHRSPTFMFQHLPCYLIVSYHLIGFLSISYWQSQSDPEVKYSHCGSSWGEDRKKKKRQHEAKCRKWRSDRRAGGRLQRIAQRKVIRLRRGSFRVECSTKLCQRKVFTKYTLGSRNCMR